MFQRELLLFLRETYYIFFKTYPFDTERMVLNVLQNPLTIILGYYHVLFLLSPLHEVGTFRTVIIACSVVGQSSTEKKHRLDRCLQEFQELNNRDNFGM